MRQRRESGDRPILGNEVATALDELSQVVDVLQLARKLRSRFSPGLAREVAELHSLRRRGKSKFPTFTLPYLTSKGLEQSSAEEVAKARAQEISSINAGASLLDATCGIGADSMALALGGLRVVSADLDLKHCDFARANLMAQGLKARVVRADALRSCAHTDLLLLDPDRRVAGKRSMSPREWSPTLPACLGLTRGFAGACIRPPPAVDVDRWPEMFADYPELRLQWVSRNRELAELNLWLGNLAGEERQREAVVLGRRQTPAKFRGEPAEVAPLSPTEAADVAWISEPDPALIRSGLLGLFASQQDLRPLAERIAYLGGDHPTESPFCTTYRVLGSSSLDRKRVRELLARHAVGPVTVKKRGHPDSSTVLEGRFRGTGPARGTLIVARLDRGHRAWLVEPETRVGGD